MHAIVSYSDSFLPWLGNNIDAIIGGVVGVLLSMVIIIIIVIVAISLYLRYNRGIILLCI